MHRVYIWTQRPLKIRFRAITASSECEGRDKQPNSKQTKHRHPTAPPRNPGCVVLSTQRLSTQLNTQARSTLKIGTEHSGSQHSSTHRQRLSAQRLSTLKIGTGLSTRRSTLKIGTGLSTHRQRLSAQRLSTLKIGTGLSAHRQRLPNGNSQIVRIGKIGTLDGVTKSSGVRACWKTNLRKGKLAGIGK